jgi:hypothetical protein
MFRAILLLVVATAISNWHFPPALAMDVAWIRQPGTISYETASGIATDGHGGFFVSGYTQGDLANTNAGSDDAFLLRYDADGALIWSRQFGTPVLEYSQSVDADLLGNVFMGGHTHGSLAADSAGATDVWVSRHNADGQLGWIRQFGTVSDEYATDVAADGAGNVLVTGYTAGLLDDPTMFAPSTDPYLAKFDNAGNLLWSRQFGSGSDDRGFAVAADGSGNAYVAGNTSGDFAGSNSGSTDVFLTKYSANGGLLWSRQFGSDDSDDLGGAAFDPAGFVYLAGHTVGDLAAPNSGANDIFLAKYDLDGNQLWIRQVGSNRHDIALDIVVGPNGVSLAGWTDAQSSGISDLLVLNFDPAGNLNWQFSAGTGQSDIATGIASDAAGNLYLSGSTEGSFGADNQGFSDAVVLKLQIPEPTSFVLFLGAAFAMLVAVPRRQFALGCTLRLEANPLSQRQLIGIVDRVGRPPHVGLPGIGA